jgi:hypothetical protein
MRTASDSFIKNLKDSIFSDNTLTNIFNKVTDLKKYQFFEYTENAEEFNKPVKKAVVNESVIEFDLNGDVLEPVQPPINVDKGVEISSNAKGLAAALTNPTELAKSKGNLTQSYPVQLDSLIGVNKKGINSTTGVAEDAEAAYQALKSTATKDDGPNSTYNLMVNIIKAKLEQYPRLVSEITKQGGSSWILSATHQPTKQNSVWETGGKNWFIKALNDAYVFTTQPSTSVNKFDKKNIFTVTPIQTADKKATIKASIATQYIGYGEGIAGSSTETYRQQAGVFANTGNYSADDVIFVSIGGRRGTAEQQKTQQDRTIKEAIKAIEAGATILTDNKAYTDSNSYNTGEKRLYANMEANGYNYSEITVDGQVIGTWSKSTQSSTSVEVISNSKVKYTRNLVENNPRTLFIFTDNTDRTSGNNPNVEGWYAQKYGTGLSFGTVNNPTTAVIRGKDNAYPISTMKWFYKNHGVSVNNARWTDADINEFKKVIDDEINQIKKAWNNGNYDNIIIPSGDGFFNSKIANISKERTPALYNYLEQSWNNFKQTLSSTQSSTSAPIREELEGLSEAREAYKSLFIANKKPPITFTVGVSTWKLNKNFNYDLIDQDTGEVQLKNVNMVTGMIEEDAVEYTILTRKQLNDYIKDFEQKVITFNLEDLLAVYGIDIQDVYKRLNSATTTEDLIEIETEINRILCQ